MPEAATTVTPQRPLAAACLSQPASPSHGLRRTFRCTLAELQPGQSRVVSMAIGSAAEGTYELRAIATSDYLDAFASDNQMVMQLIVIPAPLVPPPTAPSTPPPAASPLPIPLSTGGGGGVAAWPRAPLQQTLLALVGLALLGHARRFASRRQEDISR